MSKCTECGEQFNPELSGGVDICQDCFDSMLDCKSCGDSFNNDINNPVDTCPECEAIQSKVTSQAAFFDGLDAQPAPTPASKAVDFYIANQINEFGYDFSVFNEYGINAAQVTKVATIICWTARTDGRVMSEVDGVTAHSIGDPMLGLMGYSLYGEDCTVYEWLDEISDVLRARFEAEFGRRANV